MNLMPYFCLVIGESPDSLGRLHPSTLRRIQAYATAIHIPVLLWAVAGYVLGSQVFNLPSEQASWVAGGCAILIFLIERLVLAAPGGYFVSVGRILIGVVVAVLGASAVDLVLFDREITQELISVGDARLEDRYSAALQVQQGLVDQTRTDWLKARQAADCEANGTCGSGLRSVGPIYLELDRQAETLREDYVIAERKRDAVAQERDQAIQEWESSPVALREAGLLARIEALKSYTGAHPAARFVWVLFFSLMLFLEMTVVLVKLVFGKTVDDRIAEIREKASHARAVAYHEAITSPVAEARRLMEGTHC